MNELTIFTPTYNRRDVLERLYASLKSQTQKEFSWMIIDDGSIDGTEKLVQKWMKEKYLHIRYFYQENQGKHIAMKSAIEQCQTTWFVCVDSDDTLPPNTVEDLLTDADSPLPSGCIGYIYPQNMSEENDCGRFPDTIGPIHIMDAKNIYKISETAILFQTRYLKKLKFYRFPNEKFLSEEILYIQLAQCGRFVPKNRTVYCSIYQKDGLTRNLFRYWMENPQGTILLLTLRYRFCGQYGLQKRIWERIKCISNFNAFCIACSIALFRYTPSKWYSIWLYLPALLWRKMRFRYSTAGIDHF